MLLTARWTVPGQESSKQGARAPGPPHCSVRWLLLQGHQILQGWPHCIQSHAKRQRHVTDSRGQRSGDRGHFTPFWWRQFEAQAGGAGQGLKPLQHWINLLLLQPC